MTVSQKWFLAFGTNKMLNVPVLAKSGDDALFDRSSARAADWYSHLVVATETVELSFHFPRIYVQLDAASRAVKMVRMIGFSSELDVAFFNNSMALITNIFPTGCSFFTSIALMTQRSPGILDETLVRKCCVADLTAKTFRMPIVVHGLDHTANDKIIATPAARCK